MNITDELLDQLARLSGLTIKEDERLPVKEELEQILSYMSRIEALELPEEEISALVGREGLRADEPGPSIPRADLLGIAPETDGTYYLVPKTVE